MNAVRRKDLNKKKPKILVLNTRYISTGITVYEEREKIIGENIRHTVGKVNQFSHIKDQTDYRYGIILDFLKNKKIDIDDIDYVVAKAGPLKPIESGTYVIDENMVNDLEIERYGTHSSNLGPLLAYNLFKNFGMKPFIVDPVVVDEMEDVARITGIKAIQRKSYFHALSQKAIAKAYSKTHHKRYEDINLVVAHIGSGITVGAHKNGRVIDVNNGLEGEGPFSPEHSGSVPITDLVKLCFSGKYTLEEMIKHVNGKGGCMAYVNHSDVRVLLEQAKKGDEKSRVLFNAMAYQITKEIAKCAVVLEGKVDAILITGGLAYCNQMVEKIKERVSRIAPIIVYKGKDEMLYLVEGVLRVLNGEEKEKYY
ncbi:butyrate kinase [Hathewaya histolytica]|uniref:Probable butyrate kinase n=1 Tax=Hathewaya histolytica TaxID=1498 RepID=A0A4U9R366_HATHI|nr:butyrate kinase [Hathewaya histolytica]VTQ83150.1 butyrate kinase [Hathewaya histolytica]